ncbi:hypothetical protein GWI33_019844 [Rhynchophorus ferrugineus]|uniref:Uncharacterized protein n=1 Tax=Rhynchophorus ferrugineus TaxID=354439 RepID=A0A834HST8_RHYFE|nr:hypothetical protein GWI33_019844 [Rhynchophorus ferrugineus]
MQLSQNVDAERENDRFGDASFGIGNASELITKDKWTICICDRLSLCMWVVFIRPMGQRREWSESSSSGDKLQRHPRNPSRSSDCGLGFWIPARSPSGSGFEDSARYLG